MDQNQTASIIRLIMTYFRNAKFGETEQEQLLTLEAWHGILKDYDVQEVGNNLVSYVKTGAAFAPQPGQLIPKRKEGVKYVPNAEDTKRYLLDMQHREALALNDPGLEQARIQAQKEIRKVLGMDEG